MGQSNFTATIKKIEIINRAGNDSFDQSIRIILGDIELNNDNLIELRKFRPNEPVGVKLQTQQLTFGEAPEGTDADQEVEITGHTDQLEEESDQPLITLLEGDEEPDPANIVEQFDFS